MRSKQKATPQQTLHFPVTYMASTKQYDKYACSKDGIIILTLYLKKVEFPPSERLVTIA